jgi:hypothetical protein
MMKSRMPRDALGLASRNKGHSYRSLNERGTKSDQSGVCEMKAKNYKQRVIDNRLLRPETLMMGYGYSPAHLPDVDFCV